MDLKRQVSIENVTDNLIERIIDSCIDETKGVQRSTRVDDDA